MSANALSDVLRAVKLTGAVFVTIDVSPPWSAAVPAAWRRQRKAAARPS